MKNSKNIIISALILIILVILAANFSHSDKAPKISVLGGASEKKLETAKETALGDCGLTADKATFIKAKTDKDDGKTVFEVEFVAADTKYEYEIKNDGKTILEVSKEPVEQLTGFSENSDLISADDAKTAALNAFGFDEAAVTFTKIKSDYDDGKYEYEIEFFANSVLYECEIDAVSGKVNEMKTER